MNKSEKMWARCKALVLVSVSSALMIGCSPALVKPTGPIAARAKLTELQADPRLSGRVPVALKDAELAVARAEMPQQDVELAAHLAYVADRKVDTARALAETRYAEDQRQALRQQRENVRLAARTREAEAAVSQATAAEADAARQKNAADRARNEAGQARNEADQARNEADQARNDALSAKAASTLAADQAAELQRQINDLQAKVTDRGLVLTLGDVLFASGQASLRPTANGNLDKLVTFLGKYPDRSIAIEGHTDSIGSAQYNQDLSLRRAEAVSSYLIGRGVSRARISTTGKGKDEPVAGNESADGRQQNRRVEVIVENPAVAQR